MLMPAAASAPARSARPEAARAGSTRLRAAAAPAKAARRAPELSEPARAFIRRAAQAFREWLSPGDAIVVTDQDHEANSGAWRRLAATGIVSGVFAGLSTVFFLLGVEVEPTSTVVAGSVFPAFIVLVGRVVYGDEVLPRQVVGVGVVLVGVGLVSLS